MLGLITGGVTASRCPPWTELGGPCGLARVHHSVCACARDHFPLALSHVSALGLPCMCSRVTRAPVRLPLRKLPSVRAEFPPAARPLPVGVCLPSLCAQVRSPAAETGLRMCPATYSVCRTTPTPGSRWLSPAARPSAPFAAGWGHQPGPGPGFKNGGLLPGRVFP